MKAYKLHFTSPLHLGNEREDYAGTLRSINSDVIYAALTAVLAKVGYDIPEGGDLGFTISSLFPFYQEKEKSEPVYFFPKPFLQTQLDESLIPMHKDIKKIKWLDTDTFNKLCKGESVIPKDRNSKNNFEDEMKGEYQTKNKVPTDFIKAQVFPRASVPRTGVIDGEQQDTKIYYIERLFFKNYSGFWFLADGDYELIEKALDVLKHEGIGTDRNVGNGFFFWKEGKVELPKPLESNYSMNLSMFLPESKNQLTTMIDNKSAYSLIKRGGWVTKEGFNTIRKNRIYMFEAGSVFKHKTKDICEMGTIENLKPEIEGLNNIYRSGKAFFIPFKLQ